MQTAKVVGNVVSTAKSELLLGQKLLVVQIQATSKYVVAVDATNVAGYGDIVYLLSGKEASFALMKGMVPVDYSIIGLVD